MKRNIPVLLSYERFSGEGQDVIPTLEKSEWYLGPIADTLPFYELWISLSLPETSVPDANETSHHCLLRIELREAHKRPPE